VVNLTARINERIYKGGRKLETIKLLASGVASASGREHSGGQHVDSKMLRSKVAARAGLVSF
jgi:hypothetical protein